MSSDPSRCLRLRTPHRPPAVTPGWRTLPGIRIANGSHLQAPIEADRDRRGGGRMNPIDSSDGILVALEYSCVTFKRSEERRVGKECVSTCRTRWSQYQ